LPLPSNALSVHFRQLLLDAEELDDAHNRLKTGNSGRQYGLAPLNRAIVVMSVSAWESYIEELMREAVRALRPAVPPLGAWPALDVYVNSRINIFNTPNPNNVDRLIRECVGLTPVSNSWSWRNCTSAQAVQRLTVAMNYRHEISHGVNPRPLIHNHYASQLPEFFRRLARGTDDAVRNHLAGVYGIAAPWPP
jgi:hypothetical protein